MPAHQRHAMLHEHMQPAAHDLGEDRVVEALLGETGDRHRRDRRAAHGPHVIDGIERRDASEVERIVHDGREEIHRLHDGEIVAQLIHGGIVCVIKADEQIGILRLSRKPAQNLREGGGRQLGSSTGAVHELGEADLHGIQDRNAPRLQWRSRQSGTRTQDQRLKRPLLYRLS